MQKRICDHNNCERDAAVRVEFIEPGGVGRTWGTWDFCSFVHAMRFRDKLVVQDQDFGYEEARVR